MKRILALTVSLVMGASVLAGCGGNAATPTNAPTEAPANTPAAVDEPADTPAEPAAEPAPADVASTDGVTYPLVTDGSVTLEYYFWLHGAALQFVTSNEENLAWQEIEKNTGINIEWTHPVIGQEAEQFSTMIASQDLPDLLGDANRYPGGFLKGEADGAYIDLTDLIPQYAPDYYSIVTANDEIKRQFAQEDGRFIHFEGVRPVDLEPAPPWCRISLRSDWLEEFGMEIPWTYDELAAYFEKVKTEKGVTPFSYFPVDHWMNEILTGGYDVKPDFMVWDNKITHGKIQEGWRDYLVMMADWYAKGYISPDFSTPYDESRDYGLLSSGQLGMAVGSTDVLYNFVNSANGSFEASPLPYPRKTRDQVIHTAPRSNYTQGWETCVSSQSENPELAVKFMNYLFTDEGSHLLNYGPEGVTHTMVNGKPQFTDAYMNPTDFTFEAAGYIMKAHFATKRGIPDHILGEAMGSANSAGLAMRTMWSDDETALTDIHLPPLKLTSDENNENATLMSDINTYMNEFAALFITGERTEADWDSYIETVKSLGIDRAIEIHQAAYDRYMGN
jgi:putative aldouronate transport system substrate-binding protein